MLFIWMLMALPLFAEELDSAKTAVSPTNYSMADSYDPSTRDVSENDENTKMSNIEYLGWPLKHIIQPILDALVYPFAAPIRYANRYKVIDTGLEAASFGKKRNIYLFPTLNLKPGTRTQIGIGYRHRNIIFQKDYFVASASLFVNSDQKYTVRYTKRNLFGSDFLAGIRFDLTMDRDASFAVPRSLTLFDKNEEFVFTDSSYATQFRIGHPFPLLPNMDIQAEIAFWNNRYDFPDVTDSILVEHPKFNPNTRGLYQNSYEVPIRLALTYDNTDAPFVPTRGSRITTAWTYTNVLDYYGDNVIEGANDLSHDFQTFDIVAQHYFYLGDDNSQYGLSAAEAREFRKFYSDFSWDETLRLWRPENIRNTLLNRRVLAIQFRLRQMWEMETGGAPFYSFPTAGGTYPLRGYSMRFSDYSLKGLSLEYRWPIDRLVDGVLFNEYVMYSRQWYEIDGDKFVNSWGLGVRVRKPDMYLFRFQIGFHGFHGISIICTVAPEFQ